jgi:transposase
MTAEEQIAQLKEELAAQRAQNAMLQAKLEAQRAENRSLQAENTALRADNAQLREQMEHMLVRLVELEGRLAKDSHNSSKPPSSDGLARKPHRQRQPSGKKSGGQPGHAGHSLQMVEQPDTIVSHRPRECGHCHQPLEGVAGQVVERRQVQDLPVWRVEVKEHQVEEVVCPSCQQVSQGTFPAEVSAPAQYGPGVRALAVYLHQYQLVPMQRTCEVLSELCGCEVSEGTLVGWIECAAEALEPTMEQIAQGVLASPLQHADETGVRLGGKLHWMHVNSTRFLTHLAWHGKRGREALEAIGIWPRYQGRSMRDRWASYDRYSCLHSICGAHLVRDLIYEQEQKEQAWAGEMKEVLLDMHEAANEWRLRGAPCLPPLERDEWIAQYFDVLATGFAAQPPPSPQENAKRRGRRKQTSTKNLLDDLLRRAEQVLAFLDDLRIPFTNNQAERDLRMVKVQQKIAGTFRSEAGITAYCRIRSYLGTMRKQGQAMLAALAAVFAGCPLPIAWEL